MEKDLKDALKYLSQNGYGCGTNYTTKLVAVLLANYKQEQLKNCNLQNVMAMLPNEKEAEISKLVSNHMMKNTQIPIEVLVPLVDEIAKIYKPFLRQ